MRNLRGDDTQAGREARRARTASAHRTQAPSPIARVNPVLVIECLIVALIAAFVVWQVASCAGSGGKAEPAPGGSKYGMANYTDYDWDNLSKDSNGRLAYTADGERRSKTGIDVSEHQNEVDWRRVAADDVQFAIIRLGARGTTEGTVKLDERYAENLTGARDAGLSVGVYFFSQATSEDEAREEARFVLDTLDGTRLDYPVVYDLEETGTGAARADNMTTEQETACAKAFCETIAAAGYTPMIYGNSNDISHYSMDDLHDYPLWFASYNNLPDGPVGFNIWQYTDTGTVDGIETPADLSIQIKP